MLFIVFIVRVTYQKLPNIFYKLLNLLLGAFGRKYCYPDSTRTSQRRLFDVCVYICKTYFLGCLLISDTSIGRLILDAKQMSIRCL